MSYIGVNNIAKKLKNIAYIGVDTEVPNYGPEIFAGPKNTTEIAPYLSIEYGDHNFGRHSSSGFNVWVPSNRAYKDTVATTKFTALCELKIDYYASIFPEPASSLTLKIGDILVYDNFSNTGEESIIRSGSIVIYEGQTIEISYTEGVGELVQMQHDVVYQMTIYPRSGNIIKGTAKRIKKAYKSIGGIARPIPALSDKSQIEYYGQVHTLETARSGLCSTTLDDKALFWYDTNASKGLYYYNEDLTQGIRNVNSSLWIYGGTVASTGIRAIFAGGKDYDDELPTKIYSFKTGTLACTAVEYGLSEGRYNLVSCGLDNLMIFSGGDGYITDADGFTYSEVISTSDAINDSLTRLSSPELLYPRSQGCSARVANYALFAGGYIDIDFNTTYDVEAIDNNLIHYGITNWIPQCHETGTARIFSDDNEYAIFVGGLDSWNGYGWSEVWGLDCVTAIDKDLTRIDLPDMLATRYGVYSAISFDSEFIVAGIDIAGGASPTEYSYISEAYDSTFCKYIIDGFTNERICGTISGARMGKFGLYVGGRDTNSDYLDSVESYIYGGI